MIIQWSKPHSSILSFLLALSVLSNFHCQKPICITLLYIVSDMSSWNFRSPKYTLSFCFSHNSSLDHHHNQDFLESGEYFVISYPFTQFLLCSEPFASVNLNPTLIQLSKDGEFNLKSEVFSHFHLNFTDHQPLYLSDTFVQIKISLYA